MPYIKVPEFKSGETIEADKFNESFESVQTVCDKLDGTNFSDESLGFDELPSSVALINQDRASFYGQSVLHADMFPDPFNDYSSDLYPFARYSNYVHPKNNLITVSSLTGGEQYIIRASCRIHIPDMGARTYYDGVPAFMKVGLFQFPGESAIAEASINTSTKRLRSTEQHFRVVFSTKVPSASSCSNEAKVEDGGFSALMSARHRLLGSSWEYRDNRGGSDDRPDDDYDAHDPAQNQDRMPMGGHFTYTTCYLYEHPTTGSPDSTQSFGIMCYLSGMDTGISVTDNTAGGGLGCVTPKKLPATITDGVLTMYQVRR